MVAEIISVGTELLLGNVVNTNTAYLAEKCALLGISLYYQSVVGDNEERLASSLKIAMNRSDIVILTGGMGPTQDDLTKETVAKALGLPLVEDAHSRDRITAFYRNMGISDIPENSWKQALVPEGCMVLENRNGTAPGIVIEKNGKSIVLLPGPPGELIPMFDQQVFDYLNRLRPEIIYSVMVKLCGLSESAVEKKIQDLIQVQTNPVVTASAKIGEVHLRVTAKAADEKEAKKLVKPVLKQLAERLGHNIYTMDEKVTLEESVLDMLRKRGLTLTTAESLTGGMLAARLTSVPGASDVFKQGLVTYCNRAKRKLLDVKKSTLKDYGAVSDKTAKEMAKNGVFATGADVCVSLTGLAGPAAEENKPVGLVYIACCYQNRVTVQEHHFNGDRAKIRESAAVSALTLLRECILAENQG